MLGALFASQDFDGDLTSAGAWGKAFWWFHNNWTWETRLAYNPETVNPRRSRGGPLSAQSARHRAGRVLRHRRQPFALLLRVVQLVLAAG